MDIAINRRWHGNPFAVTDPGTREEFVSLWNEEKKDFIR